MTTDYRALCAELVDKLHEHTSMWEGHEIDLVTRARALLAQPEPEGPDGVHPFVVRHYTDDERPSIKGNGFDGLEIGEDRQEAEEFVAWINERICPTPQPVAVSERLPGPEDCDEQGRCWWLKQRANPDHDLLMPTWHLQRQGPAGTTFFRFTHWLPANALPTPETNAQ